MTETAEMMWYDSCCSNTTYFMKIRVNRSVKGKAHIIFQARELLLPSARSACQLSGVSPSIWAQIHLFLQTQCSVRQGHGTGACGVFAYRWSGEEEENNEGLCRVLSSLESSRKPWTTKHHKACAVSQVSHMEDGMAAAVKREPDQSIYFCGIQLLVKHC